MLARREHRVKTFTVVLMCPLTEQVTFGCVRQNLFRPTRASIMFSHMEMLARSNVWISRMVWTMN